MTESKTGRFGKYHIKDNRNIFFYPNEWDKIFNMAKEKQKMTMDFLINTGARINEVRNIKVKDIDFMRNNIIIMVTKVRAKKGEKKPTPRPISISSKFARRLNKYIKKYKLDPEDTFPLITTQGMGKVLKRLSEKIKKQQFEDISTHNIRKTTETWLVAMGVDSLKVAKHLGHSANVAFSNYLSGDLFTYDEKRKIRIFFDDLFPEAKI
jgi:integrase